MDIFNIMQSQQNKIVAVKSETVTLRKPHSSKGYMFLLLADFTLIMWSICHAGHCEQVVTIETIVYSMDCI